MREKHTPRTLDSLALAYFLSGEAGRAAAVQRRAIALLGDADPQLRAALEEKLAKYVRAAEEAGLEIPDDEEVI